MLPIRWDPGRDLSTLRREFDDLTRRVFGVTREEEGGWGGVAAPAVNSYIKEGTLHFEAELPGVKTGQLDVRIDGRDLIIAGERRTGHTEEKADFLLHESRIAKFERRLTLPEGADVEKAHATYRDGLLEITMPVTEAKTKGRKLVIEGLESGRKSKEIH
jgi:HSP20 family protein